MQPIERCYVEELSGSWVSEALGPGRWARVGVIGEGSCFFHSLCYVTNRDNYVTKNEKDQMSIAQTFRCQTFREKFTKEAQDRFKETVPDYDKTQDDLTADFCKANVWADEVMIKFAASLLGQNILFLDLKGEKMQCNVFSQDTMSSLKSDEPLNQPTILVAWVSRSHFEPIVKIVNAEEGRLRTIQNPAMSREDQDSVKYIMKRLSTACRIK